MTRDTPEALAHPEGAEEEVPAPRELLDDPEIRARIERARDRIRRGETTPGMSVDQLLELARERRLDP